MADVIKKVDYFAVEVADKPGEAHRILSALSKEGVNLLAFSGFPRGRKAQLDFIPRDTARFRRAARKIQLALKPAKLGFLVQGRDRKGAVASVLEKLAAAGINVIAIDAVSAGGARWGAIFWVRPGDVARASRALGLKK